MMYLFLCWNLGSHRFRLLFGYCIWWRQLNKIRRKIISSYKCLLNCYFNFSRTTFYFCISILQPITWGFPWVAYSIVYQFIMLFGVIALVSWVLFYFPGSSYIAGSQVGLDCVLAYQMLFLHNCIFIWLILISVMLKRFSQLNLPFALALRVDNWAPITIRSEWKVLVIWMVWVPGVPLHGRIFLNEVISLLF